MITKEIIKRYENNPILKPDDMPAPCCAVYNSGVVKLPSGEYIMMGSLVNSFIKAFEAGGMSITVNGSVLESGHTIYDFTMSFFEN